MRSNRYMRAPATLDRGGRDAMRVSSKAMPSVRVDTSVVVEATKQQVVQFSQILPLDIALSGWPGETFIDDIRRQLETGETFKASTSRSGVRLGVVARLLKPGE